MPMSENKKNLVKHHLFYKPTMIELIPHREHQEIHGNIPIINELNLKMRQYDKLVKLSVMIKNWTWAYEREFGETPINLNLEQIEKKKKEMLKKAKPLVKNDLKKVKHIRGLGLRYLAGLLAYAHPNRFPTLHRYLYYCGYTGASKVTKRYNRKVKSLVYQIVKGLIMHRDPVYYQKYLKIKSELSDDYPKHKKDGVARNRVGTLLLKEFYRIFK